MEKPDAIFGFFTVMILVVAIILCITFMPERPTKGRWEVELINEKGEVVERITTSQYPYTYEKDGITVRKKHGETFWDGNYNIEIVEKTEK